MIARSKYGFPRWFIALAIGWYLAVTPCRAWADLASASDLQVDHIALEIQTEAIAKASRLLIPSRGTPLERSLLADLTEMEQEAASVEFRIAHEIAAQRGTDAQLDRYHRRLEQVVVRATQAVQLSSTDEDSAHLVYTRAQAYEELGHKDLARKDYLFLSAHFPKSTWAIRGNMALADQATENNSQAEAITYLQKIEEKPDDPHYPFALNKMAWSYFNLKDIKHALFYIEQEIQYYDKKKNLLKESELAIREHALLDATEFFFGGLDYHLPGYGIFSALSYFRKLERGPSLGKMLLRFAKLLRSRKMSDGLRQWNDLVITEEPTRSETLDVISNTVDVFVELRQYDQIVTLLSGYSRVDELSHHEDRWFASYVTALKYILNVATDLQKVMANERLAEKTRSVNEAIAAAYVTYLAVTEPSDPLSPQVHYNLAETWFQLKAFPQATEHYRWLVDHHQAPKELSTEEVRRRLLVSRYEELLESKMIAGDVTPQPLAGSSPIDWKSVEPRLAEWVKWIDAYEKRYGDTDETVEKMRIAANLTLYHLGNTRAVVDRLKQRLDANPDNPHAIADASLVLDTYVKSSLWQDTEETASSFLQVPQLAKEPFGDKLRHAKADALYKQLEVLYQSKDYGALLKRVEPYLRKVEHVDRAADCLFLASRAASQLQKPRASEQYLNIILSEFPDAPTRNRVLLARGALEEGNYHFENAIADYETFLKGADSSPKVPEKQTQAIQRQVQILKWFVGNPSPLDCSAFPSQSAVAPDCEKYQALILLRLGKVDASSLAIDKALSGFESNRSLWAALALRSDAPIPIARRMRLVETLALGWGSLDTLPQFALIPELTKEIPDAFGQARRSLESEAPLKPSGTAITRRIKAIQAMETTAAQTIKLPWSRVRVAALNEVAQAYLSFARELSLLSAPKGVSAEELAAYQRSVQQIIQPFEKKGQTLLGQAREMGAELAIDPSGLDGLTENPSRSPASSAIPIGLDLLDHLEGKTWSNLVIGVQPTPQDNLRALWVDALQRKDYGRMAFFSQELQRTAKPDKTVTSLMKAISLYTVGARAEALQELGSLRSELPEKIRDRAGEALLSNYEHTLASKKTEALSKAIKDELMMREIKKIKETASEPTD